MYNEVALLQGYALKKKELRNKEIIFFNDSKP